MRFPARGSRHAGRTAMQGRTLIGRCRADPLLHRRKRRLAVELARLAADSIVASAGDAIVAADREGIIRVWNAGAVRIFGYGPDEALGVSLDLIIPEHLRAAHWAGWRAVVSTGRSRYGGGDLLSVPGLRKD